jgi:hypothetical protein
MKKIILSEGILVLLLVAVIIGMAFFSQNIYVSKQAQAVTIENASRSITFNLVKGQTVTGSLNYTEGNYGNWFTLYDSEENPLVSGSYDYRGRSGSFSFTADTDGVYYLGVGHLTSYLQYLDYEYSISPPPILGLSPIVLIGLIVAIGVALMIVTTYLNMRPSKKSNKT